MQICETPIERIKPYANNPRNNEAAVSKVAASIREFGFRQPIVVDKDMVVIAGHTRLLASRQLGLKTVPVHIAEGLSEAQVKAYRLADNRTHADAEWNKTLLGIELGDLKNLNFDLGITGFSQPEIEQIFKGGDIEMPDENAVPHEKDGESERFVSALGDMWSLGNHKLLCGDATRSDNYKKLLGSDNHEAMADMVFTDPPYNVEYSRGARERIIANATGRARGKILNDDLGTSFREFLKTVCGHLVAHCNGGVYIAMAAAELDTLQNAFRDSGGYWSTFIIWAKNHFNLTNSDYHRQYEVLLYGWPKGKKRFWCGARDQSDLWNIKKPDSSFAHPTMKPVAIPRKAIENSSKPNDVVLDAFGGAGGTLIACESSNRRCRMMELDPKYCDVIIERWQTFTGRDAVLGGSDKTFSQIKAERLKALKILNGK